MVVVGTGKMPEEEQDALLRLRLGVDPAVDDGDNVVQPPAVRRHVSPPMREDDPDGNYVFNLGENLTQRYKILWQIGKGTSGIVLECWDRQTKEHVAIKVVRNTTKYVAGLNEVCVLQRLARNDKAGKSHCLQIRTWFNYRDHVCIVCEKLGPNLSEFLQIHNSCPFPLDLVRDIGRQLLESIAYVHGLDIVHTDVTTENILLVSSECVMLPVGKSSSGEMAFKCLPKSSAIKLIDFSSCQSTTNYHRFIVTPRNYRAPEIILGLGWNRPCDLWSIGCVLVELCVGKKLFDVRDDNLEHLAMIERVLGVIPEHMIRKAERSAENYFKESILNWPGGASSIEIVRFVKSLQCLKDRISEHVDLSRSSFIDLLYGLLKFDPIERLTAKEALDHPFFNIPSST